MSLKSYERLRIKASGLEGFAMEINDLADEWEDELKVAEDEYYTKGYEQAEKDNAEAK